MVQPFLDAWRGAGPNSVRDETRGNSSVYFPTDGMISLLVILKTGEAIEIAASGREGAIGTKLSGLMPASISQNASQIKDVHNWTSSCGRVAHSESWIASSAFSPCVIRSYAAVGRVESMQECWQ
jgi:hypothetical protein